MRLGTIRGQRGAGAIGCLLVLAVIGAAIYAGFMIGMPKLRYSSFSDRLTESIFHIVREPDDVIQKQIIQMAAEFDIALTPEQVKVKGTGGQLQIDVAYEKEVDLMVWKTTLPFELHRTIPR